MAHRRNRLISLFSTFEILLVGTKKNISCQLYCVKKSQLIQVIWKLISHCHSRWRLIPTRLQCISLIDQLSTTYQNMEVFSVPSKTVASSKALHNSFPEADVACSVRRILILFLQPTELINLNLYCSPTSSFLIKAVPCQNISSQHLFTVISTLSNETGVITPLKTRIH